ncbi:MAG: indole-3-glycerol phosphate synthase TrpC [Lachnospiraceae bacterium]|nr:indole-3-glycerol phosphate synthase TrpC [Lachnospiraceae bacterium]
MSILEKIALRTKERIEAQKREMPFAELKKRVCSIETKQGFPFEKALRSEELAFICEVKKASPTKGIISENFPYLAIGKEYEMAGAAAISVLTEPYFFQGADVYLREIAEVVKIPLLRKDFVIDAYMIYEAKILGAAAVLFICSLLEKETLLCYIKIAHDLGLSALVEVHDEVEVQMAIDAGAKIIGVNHRNLKTFAVDIGLSERLRGLVPKEIIFISESGIRNPKDVARLQAIEVDGVLIGESIMRSQDKKVEIQRLRGYRHDKG